MPTIFPNEISNIKNYFNPKNILEIGSGDNSFSDALKKNNNYKVYTLDIIGNQDFTCKFEDLKTDLKFDLLCFRESIYYIDPYILHSQIDNLLNKDGGIYIKSVIVSTKWHTDLETFSKGFKVKFFPTRVVLEKLLHRYRPIVKYYSGWINWKYYRKHGIFLYGWK